MSGLKRGVSSGGIIPRNMLTRTVFGLVCGALGVLGATYNVNFNNPGPGAVYDVTPTGELNVWSEVGPRYPDIQAKVGDTVTFTAFSLHNVVKFANRANYDQCTVTDTTSYTVLSPVQFPPTVYTFRYTITTAGSHYLACAVDDHCKLGMKVIIVASAADSSPAKTVYLREVGPIWAIGLKYPDVTINAGDSLRFISHHQHNVVMFNTAADYDACSTAFTELLDWDGEAGIAERVYRFDSPGMYFVACTEDILHCSLGGMKFKVTVLPARAGASERDIANKFALRFLQGDPSISLLLAPGATATAPMLTNLGITGGQVQAVTFLAAWRQAISASDGAIKMITTNVDQFVVGLSSVVNSTAHTTQATVMDLLVAQLQNGLISQVMFQLDPAYAGL